MADDSWGDASAHCWPLLGMPVSRDRRETAASDVVSAKHLGDASRVCLGDEALVLLGSKVVLEKSLKA